MLRLFAFHWRKLQKAHFKAHISMWEGGSGNLLWYETSPFYLHLIPGSSSRPGSFCVKIIFQYSHVFITKQTLKFRFLLLKHLKYNNNAFKYHNNNTLVNDGFLPKRCSSVSGKVYSVNILALLLECEFQRFPSCHTNILHD